MVYGARENVTAKHKFYWEDFRAGETAEYGAYRVTAHDIKAFAAEFDPQDFHLDEEAASGTLLGGLAASGWHTCGMAMRMMCDGYLLDAASMGSPGVDDVRWLHPVRPGDVLRTKRTCIETRASRSRPEMGICRFTWDVFNQYDTHLMSLTGTSLFERRPAGGAR